MLVTLEADIVDVTYFFTQQVLFDTFLLREDGSA